MKMRPSPLLTSPAFALGLLALILLGVILVLDIIDSRRSEFESGMRQIEQHDRMLAEHVARSFESIEMLLDEMQLSIREDNNWPQWSSERGHQYLKLRLKRSLPQIRHLVIADAEGRQRHTSFITPPPPAGLADRPYFQKLKEGAEHARYGPYVGRNSKRLSYAFARRLSEGQNIFNGVLIATIEPEYFSIFCHGTLPHDKREAAIVNGEGEIIALCSPPALAETRPAATTPVDFRQVLARGHFSGGAMPSGRSVIDDGDHVLSSKPVPGYPDIHVISATPKTMLTRGWQQHTWRVLLLALLAVSALGAAGVMIRRQLRQLSSVTQALRESQKTLEDRVQAATQELEARHNQAEYTAQAKSRFFAAASHDLRQPLHALQLFLGDLARLVETPEQKALVQRIETAALSMTTQLRGLLDLSRLDMGNIVPARVSVELAEAFSQLAATYQTIAENAGVRLLFHPLPVKLETDPALLSRMLGNLIDNAIKFSPRGTVLVCARHSANGVRIEVRDNGVGIAHDQQQSIYDEFYQVGNPARNPGAGLGLGLAIAHRISRLLDAGLSLRSAPGCGSMFSIRLPLYSAASLHPPATPVSLRLVLLGACKESDNPEDFADRARQWGYRIAVAESVDDARQKLQEEQGTLIVLCADSRRIPEATLTLLQQHAGVVISSTDCEIPEARAYHLREPVKPARLRALLRSLH